LSVLLQDFQGPQRVHPFSCSSMLQMLCIGAVARMWKATKPRVRRSLKLKPVSPPQLIRVRSVSAKSLIPSLQTGAIGVCCRAAFGDGTTRKHSMNHNSLIESR
jgi:hypothetical protein